MITSLFPPLQVRFNVADFLVKNIVDYNKIETRIWMLGEAENKKSGNQVVIRGIPDLGNDPFQRERATNRLRLILEGKIVNLKAARTVEEGVIECNVFIESVNVANYFVDFSQPL